jgi:hypothetical protein
MTLLKGEHCREPVDVIEAKLFLGWNTSQTNKKLVFFFGFPSFLSVPICSSLRDKLAYPPTPDCFSNLLTNIMGREGLQSYYQQKIEELEVVLREKEQNVRRLEAQRNEWNSKGLSTLCDFCSIHLDSC